MRFWIAHSLLRISFSILRETDYDQNGEFEYSKLKLLFTFKTVSVKKKLYIRIE